MLRERGRSTVTGLVFNIQRYSVQDGPGIRTTVFLKGCPLRCHWCSNPESQNAFPEVAHRDSLCTKCGRCVEACEVGAISLTVKGVKIDRRICTNCGKCVEVCYPEAIKIFGAEMSDYGVFYKVKSDELFYRNSGGGVTVSGGEPLTQTDFVVALFKCCRETSIHTCLDTCGYISPDILREALDYTDLVLYDIKHFDPATHRKVTGVSNQLILDNIKIVCAREIPTRVRIPLVPTINTSEEDIAAIARFIKGLNVVSQVDILPYHRFGEGKYQMLDRGYKMQGLPGLAQEDIDRLKMIIESFELNCEVVG